MKKRVLMGICSALAFAACACDDSQSVDNEVQEGTANYNINVKIDGVESGKVDLAEMTDKLIKVTIGEKESNAIRVSDIISEANNIKSSDLETYLAGYLCEYEGSDGFKPSSKGDRCKAVSCSETLKSYINTDTHTVFYDEGTDMSKQGCYGVTDVVSVIMYKAENGGGQSGEGGGQSGEGGGQSGEGGGQSGETTTNIVNIVVDGKLYKSIDISKLANGDGSVSVADILKEAGVTADLASSACEVQSIDSENADNSFYPSSKDKCAEWLSCDIVAAGSIAIGDGSNKMSYAEAQSGCYGTSGANTIEINTVGGSDTPANMMNIVVDGKLFESIDISKLANGDGSVSVADILKEAGVSADLAASTCEVQSIDSENADNSFYPSSKGKCAEWLSCDIVAAGSIAIGDGNKMSYAEAQIGCYSTSAANTIEIKTPVGSESNANMIDIVVDGELYESIDISTLANGADSVSVADILKEAGVTVDLSSAVCEAQSIDAENAENSYYPSSKGKCAEWLSCDIVAAGSIAVSDGSNKMSYAEAQSGCYGTSGTNTIAVKTSK